MKTWQKVSIGIGTLGIGWLIYRWSRQPRVGSDRRILVDGQAWVNIPFEYDSAVIPPSSYDALARIATLIKGPPSLTVNIVGHTDDAGSTEYNQGLGDERAMAVYYWLIDAGVEQSQLGFSSMGELSPVADNATPEGQATNRRVEFQVV